MSLDIDPVRSFNGGVTQAERAASAPRPERFKVDGRRRAQLLSFAERYGELIRFYDGADRPDGDWAIFFGADPRMGATRLVSFDLEAAAADFDRLLADLRRLDDGDRRPAVALDALRRVWLLLRVLDRPSASHREPGQVLERLVRSDLDVLFTAPLQELSALLLAVRHVAADTVPHALHALRTDEARFERFIQLLEALVSGLLTQLARVIQQARTTLGTDRPDGRQRPQVALWTAFVHLFTHAQARLNDFPARFVDFYFAQVLRQTRGAQRPGPTGDAGAPTTPPAPFLPGPGTTPTVAPKSTPAPATEPPLTVACLRTLRRVPAASPGHGVAATASQVLSSTVKLSPQSPAMASAFPVFGPEKPGHEGIVSTRDASMGFAIASPTLMLAGGKRTVTFGLEVEASSFASLAAPLQSIGQRAGGLSSQAVLAQVLQAAFDLAYSTSGGWTVVETWAVMPPPPGSTGPFELVITLPPSAAPWVGLSAPGAAPRPVSGVSQPTVVPDPEQPTLLARLLQTPVVLGQGAQTVRVDPYPILRRLLLSRLSLDVQVDALTQLDLANDEGPVVAGQLFVPFGSPPVQGASLYVAAPELFAKTLDSLSLLLNWSGLPSNSTGFLGYYKGYTIDTDGCASTKPLFDNSSFTATLDVVDPGRWTLPTPPVDATAEVSADPSTGTPADPDPSHHCLFSTQDGIAGPPADTQLSPQTLLVAPALLATAIPPYYDASNSRIRLSLAAPACAFGNTLYGPNVEAAALQNSAAAAACSEKCARKQNQTDQHVTDAVAQIEGAQNVNTQAAGASGTRKIGAALDAVISQLQTSAANLLLQAIDGSAAPSDIRTHWRQSLQAVLAGTGTRRWPWRKADPASAAPASTLHEWLHAHASELAAALGASVHGWINQAGTFLRAADPVIAARVESPKPQSSTRTAAALSSAQATLLADAAGDTTSMQQCVQNCLGPLGAGQPNPPWLPMMTAVSVGYDAQATLPCTDTATRFFHLQPFDHVDAVAWSAGADVPLLAPVSVEGALFIELSASPRKVALLVDLLPLPEGWPRSQPQVSWAMASADGWTEIVPDSDTTLGLRKSGTVSLSLSTQAHARPCWLRVSANHGDAGHMPLLAALGVVAPAEVVVGTGLQAAGMATALTSTAPVAQAAVQAQALKATDAGIGLLAAPTGATSLGDTAFQVWMGERMRHKNTAVQAWDHGRLVLAQFPALWQVGVAEATDSAGRPAPGHVWLVVVPGPDAPAIADSTTPYANPEMLDAIRVWLAPRVSPFVTLGVSNPPYVRIEVVADLLFSADRVAADCLALLNEELIAWLSPWSNPALGPRPAHYYTRRGIAEFIRRRPCVRGIVSISLRLDPPSGTQGWCYFTSARQHSLSDISAPTESQASTPADMPPRTPTGGHGGKTRAASSSTVP